MRNPIVLSVQSEVIRGHVGNSAARFAMQRNGIDVWALPTVLLSNHPGHAAINGDVIDAHKIAALFEGLSSNNWVKDIGGVLTGYLGLPSQAEVAADIVKAVKTQNPNAIYLCDPVFGDDDGAYAKAGVAEALARTLIPLADISCPNRFELASLTSQRIETPEDAIRAARRLCVPEVVVTSVPDEGRIANIVVNSEGAWCCTVERIESVPHGTGDLLAALYVCERLRGNSCSHALQASVSKVRLVILASQGMDELQIVSAQEALVARAPLVTIREVH